MEHRVRSFNHTPLGKIAQTFYGVVSPSVLVDELYFLTTFNACLPMFDCCVPAGGFEPPTSPLEGRALSN